MIFLIGIIIFQLVLIAGLAVSSVSLWRTISDTILCLDQALLDVYNNERANAANQIREALTNLEGEF